MKHCSGVPAWLEEWLGIGFACKMHDHQYAEGGGVKDRFKADWLFMKNVYRFCKRPKIVAVPTAAIALVGVRAFGRMPWHFKWGKD